MKIDISKYKHIIWDWNGTLLDDCQLNIDLINEFLLKRNLCTVTKDQYLDIFGFPIYDYYCKLGFDFEAEFFESISNAFVDTYDSRCFTCRLQRDAEAVLKAFENRGLTQSILSAYYQDSLEKAVKHHGIEKYFIRLIGLENKHAAGKAENGKRWIKELGCNPGKVLFIGDTVHDFEVSQVIGCDCLLVASGHQCRKRLEA